MKKTLLCVLLFALLTWLVPLSSLFLPTGLAAPGPDVWQLGSGQAPAPTAQPGTGQPGPAPSPAPQPDEPAGQDGPLLIWDEGAQQVLSVPVRDYLIGAVASEMPVDWPDEALKAQAVAAHTYALYQKAQALAAGQEYYFSADPARRQNFMTGEVLQSYWGQAYEANYARVSALVDQVLNDLVLYGGQPAATCYHAINRGHTEASQNVWEQALPYLQGVDSPLDLTATGYEATVTYTSQQMYDALSRNLAGVDLSGSPSSWFGQPSYTAAGYVDVLQVGGVQVHGTVLRTALGLRSASFSIAYDQGIFTVTTQGYGHGVGLSQWGARALALTGKGYAEILAFYYPGTQLSAGQAV